MYTKGEKRQGKDGRYSYYRLFESYRDSLGFTQRRSVLGLGRMEVFTNTDRMNFILLLNKKLRGIKDIFPNYYGEKVNTYTEDIFTQLVAMHKVDLPGMDYKADSGKDTYIKEREKRFIVKADRTPASGSESKQLRRPLLVGKVACQSCQGRSYDWTIYQTVRS